MAIIKRSFGHLCLRNNECNAGTVRRVNIIVPFDMRRFGQPENIKRFQKKCCPIEEQRKGGKVGEGGGGGWNLCAKNFTHHTHFN